MRKCFLSLLVVVMGCMVVNNLHAQNAYVTINGGYALPVSQAGAMNLWFTNSVHDNGLTTTTSPDITLGKGFNGGVAFGYLFDKHIGAELEVSCLSGFEFTARESGGVANGNYSVSANMIRLIPSVIIASGFEKINPYVKFGAVIGFGSVTNSVADSSNNEPEQMTKKYNGGLALGFYSGVGAWVKMNDKLSLFGEISMVSLAYAPTKSEITKYLVNGVDQLPGMTTKQKKTEYVDPLIVYQNDDRPDTEPGLGLKQNMPFSSFGFKLGIRYNLNF